MKSWVPHPDLDKCRRTDPRAIVDTALDTIRGGVPDHVRADYRACYDGDRLVESMRYVHRYPEELPVLAEFPAADHDPRDDRQRARQRLPDSRLEIVDAGHFVWEEAPQRCASIVVEAITIEAAIVSRRGTRR